MTGEARTVASIAAVSPEWVIGLHNEVPWRHPGDYRRFKRVTLGGTVIMGRLTWESMHGKPLPGRRNLVVTRRPDPTVECFDGVRAALDAADRGCNVWFIGGARIYEEAMAYVDLLDITFVPDHVTAPDAVHFPRIDEAVFPPGPLLPHEDEPGLTRRIYHRAPAAGVELPGGSHP
jgi:dihydrofolate reductase